MCIISLDLDPNLQNVSLSVSVYLSQSVSDETTLTYTEKYASETDRVSTVVIEVTCAAESGSFKEEGFFLVLVSISTSALFHMQYVAPRVYITAPVHKQN